MSDFATIRAMRTVVEPDFVQGSAWHESIVRSYHIVAKVKELLKRGCPNDILLEIIEDLEQGQ